MRKQIPPKKRFQVLERDKFKCKYCGKDAEHTVLEVDHIIPVKEGGDNSLQNLTTSCHTCNRGKGKNRLQNIKKELYKTKIDDVVYKLQMDFYKEWNKRRMGSIGENEKTLLKIYTNYMMKGENGNIYCTYLDIPYFYGEGSPYGEKWRNVDHSKMDKLFQTGGDFCDDVLDFMSGEVDLNDMINYVYDDDNWERDTTNGPDYSGKLNYKLTQRFEDIEGYGFIRKFSLFPHLLDD